MNLRRATIQDADFILEIRNDETTRNNSFNTRIIPRDEHITWYEKKLRDVNCLLFIIEEDNKGVGTIRLDIAGEDKSVGEVSYMIASSERGKGYGTAALTHLEEKIPQSVKVLVGLVLDSNKASCKCFEKNGYIKLIAQNNACYIKAF